MLGEVRTGFLLNSTAVSPATAAALVDLVRGERVRRSTRPIAYAASADRLVGVDCDLVTGTGARVRGVGTVTSRAALTGGHVLQGSAYVRVARDPAARRRPWSHYLGRPGELELIGRYDPAAVAAAFVTARPARTDLNLDAISLDRTPPVTLPQTRLRWAATAAGTAGLQLTVEDERLRTLRLWSDGDPAALVGLCEDIALHDWLLSALIGVVEQARPGPVGWARQVRHLRPAIDYLLHLWMPAARVDRSVRTLWKELESQPGFTRQWDASVSRIRDQIAAGILAQLSAAAGEGMERT